MLAAPAVVRMAAMSLSTIRIEDAKDCPESLAWSLQAVCRWAGWEIPYSSLTAVLGLSFLTTSTGRDDDCVCQWPTYGRDVLLLEAAAGLGLRLREAHPPEAARGLDRAPEFAQHFEASYRPMVLGAIENGQPVLAWQGWPEDRRMMWGVITEASEDGIGLAGTTVGAGGQTVALVEPPVQLYVVEEAAPEQPGERQVLRLAVEAAHRVLHESMDQRWGIVAGGEAYDLWADRVERNAACPQGGDKNARCHRLLARAVSGARQTGVDCLARGRQVLAADSRLLANTVTAQLHAAIDCLAVACDPERVEVLMRTPPGRASLAAGVRAARDLERPIGASIAELRDRLGPKGTEVA